MAIRIDINREYLVRALEASIASLKRSTVKQPNTMIIKIIEQDIAIYQNAMNTLQDVK